MSHYEPELSSDTFLGIDAFDLIRQLAFTKRVCKKSPEALKILRYIEDNTTPVLRTPIYEIEYKLRVVLETGIKPLDVIAEVHRARMQMYNLILDNQREGLFGRG
jgi:hypothetical protein